MRLYAAPYALLVTAVLLIAPAYPVAAANVLNGGGREGNLPEGGAAILLLKGGTLDPTIVGDPVLANPGDQINYTFAVTNVGAQPLTVVSVTDPLVTPISCPSGNPIPTLAIGASETCTATYAVTQADVDAGQRVNTATVSGLDNTGNPVTDTDTVTVPLPAAPSVSLVKGGTFDPTVVGDPVLAEPGDQINYTFAVTNDGTQTLTAVSVTDPIVTPISCPSGNPIPTLAPGATETCAGTYTVTQADVDAGQVVNTATASGQDPGGNPVSDTDTITVPLPAAPSLSLVKSGVFNDESGDGITQPGETIGYSFAVTNTASLTLTNVAITDPMVTPINCPSGNPIPTLAPGATETCTGTYTVTQVDVDAGQKVNTATASGQDPGGNPVSDTDSVTVPLPAAPSLSLIKSGVFNDESGDGIAQPGETIDYSLLVTNSGNQTLANIGVSDPMVAPISCPSGNPIPTLAPGTAETCAGTYTVTQADVDAGQKVNTATAGGQDPAGNPVSDTDNVTVPLPFASSLSLVKSGVFHDESGDGVAQSGETIDYSFAVTNIASLTLSNIALTDPMVTPISCPSGNPIPTLAPGATETCVGTYTVTQADVDAGQKVNTATASGTDPTGAPVSDNDSVTVLLPGPPSIVEIPALGPAGLWVFGLLLAAAALGCLRRRNE